MRFLPRSAFARLVVCWVLLGWAALGPPHWCAAADAATGLHIEKVSAGLRGFAKAGDWTAVTVEFTGPAGATVQPQAVAADPDGSSAFWPLPAVTLTGETQTVTGFVRIGQMRGELRVIVGDAAASVAINPNAAVESSQLTLTPQPTLFVGAVGDAGGLDRVLAAAAEPDSATAPETPNPAPDSQLIVFSAADELPRTALQYSPLDVLILAGEFPDDAEQSAALADWVRGGGHLILTLANDAKRLRGSPIAEWLPVSAGPPVRFRELSTLSDRSLTRAATLGASGFQVTALGGVKLADSLDGAIVVRSAFGTGRVTMCALDLTQPAFADWTDRSSLWQLLLDWNLLVDEGAATNAAETLHPTGVTELATQLASQLDHFPQVRRPSYWMVLLLAAAFVFVIGPLDYLLLSRWLKRPEWTWITLPAWLLLAALIGTGMAQRLNSSDTLANQIDLVDIDISTGQVSARSWCTVFSPEPRRFSVETAPKPWLPGAETADAQPRLSWSGVPEAGFRGMHRVGGLNLANPDYSVGPAQNAIGNLPIGQWSSKPLQADWTIRNDGAAESLVTGNLVRDADGLRGSITHRLPGELHDWCLAFDGKVYFARPSHTVDVRSGILPGVPWDPTVGTQRRILKPFLTGVTYSYAAQKNRYDTATIGRTSYNPLGLDGTLLARTLTFHEAAGGAEYTSLHNGALRRCDLSPLLTLNRAVLFGRLAQPACEYTVDGVRLRGDSQATYVRLILPVGDAASP